MQGEQETEERPERGGGGFWMRIRAPFAEIPLREIAIVVVLFVLLQWLLVALTLLPAEHFFRRVLVLEVFRHLPSLAWRLVPLLAVVGLLAWRWRSLGDRWNEWEGGGVSRVVVTVAAFVLAWPHAMIEYNFYFDQWYAVDRVLLVVCFVGMIWRPVFVWPFLVVVLTLAWQLYWPLRESLHWAFSDQALRVLILFAGFQLHGVVTRSRNARVFLFLACCMVALHYWPSGYLKVRLGWLFHDYVPFLLSCTYANGWWGGASPETIGAWTNGLGHFNLLMKGFTLLAECGVLFFFWRRRVSIVLLGMCMALHTGILLLSGICFWQWVILEGCLLLCLWKADVFRRGWFFTRGGLVVSFVIIFTSRWWLGPVGLTWFDARATYTYRFEAVGESGERYLIPPRLFGPYEHAFTAGRFRGLSREAVLPITWGATNRRIGGRLREATTPEEILAVEGEFGRVFFDEEVVRLVEDMMQRFLAGTEAGKVRPGRLSWLAAPRQIWTLPERGEFRGQERIDSVRVDQVLTFFDGRTVVEIRRRPVLTVARPASGWQAILP